MFPDPSTVRIIHDTIIREEAERHYPELRRPGIERTHRARRPPALRQATARALIRIADRIAPAPALDPEGTAA